MYGNWQPTLSGIEVICKEREEDLNILSRFYELVTEVAVLQAENRALREVILNKDVVLLSTEQELKHTKDELISWYKRYLCAVNRIAEEHNG